MKVLVSDCAPVDSSLTKIEYAVLWFRPMLQLPEFMWLQPGDCPPFTKALKKPPGVPPAHDKNAVLLVLPTLSETGAAELNAMSFLSVPWYKTLSVTVATTVPLPLELGLYSNETVLGESLTLEEWIV